MGTSSGASDRDGRNLARAYHGYLTLHLLGVALVVFCTCALNSQSKYPNYGYLSTNGKIHGQEQTWPGHS
jgi:hypothetical protein